MSIIKKFINWVESEEEIKGSPQEQIKMRLDSPYNTQPRYSQYNYRSILRQAYEQNDIVYSALNAIFSAFASAPLKVYTKAGKEMPNHPVRKLLEKPNQILTEPNFWKEVLLDYYCAGNVFIEKVYNKYGVLVELDILNPAFISIIPDPLNLIMGYKYEVDGQISLIKRENIIHIKTPRTSDQFWGFTPLMACSRRIDIDNAASDTTMVVLQNKGIKPGSILKIPREMWMDKDSMIRIKEEWDDKWRNNKKGKMAVLPSDITFESIAFNFEELAMTDLTMTTEARICAVLGVPPMLLDLRSGLEKSTYSNQEQALVKFGLFCIQPLQNLFDDCFTEGLVREFSPTNEAKFDNSKVYAFQIIRAIEKEQIMNEFLAGIISLEECREMIGYDAEMKGKPKEELIPEEEVIEEETEEEEEEVVEE